MSLCLVSFRPRCLARYLGGLSLLSLVGCAELQTSGSFSTRTLKEKDDEIAMLIERVRVLEEIIPLLACGPEIRALIQDVRSLCETMTDGYTEPICDEKKLKIAIVKAERELDAKVGKKLLQVLRHEVLYLSANGEISSRRRERLSALAQERRLPGTKFLIIAGGDDGLQRARFARSLLIKEGIPAKESVHADDGSTKQVDRYETAWKLSLSVTPNELRPLDRPSALEPKDMNRAVFIFRIDYL